MKPEKKWGKNPAYKNVNASSIISILSFEIKKKLF